MILKQLRNYSFIGRRILTIPSSVDISLLNTKEFDIPRFNRTPKLQDIVIKGPKGELSFPLYYGLQISITKGRSTDERSLHIKIDNPVLNSLKKYQEKFIRSMWGTTNANLQNMIDGVAEGHQIPIRLIGVGYKFILEGNTLSLKVGHSHLDKIEIPEGINIKLSSQTKIICSGVNLHQLTQFASKIRKFREPEPYNGKGIFIDNEKIMLKEGKKSSK